MTAPQTRRFGFVGPALALGLAVGLSACATHNGPVLTATQEASEYKAHARPEYRPPGPPGDPWGPYIVEAATRFDVPEVWVRAVIHQESSGQQFMASGVLTTSAVGAMGLMQVMPETYDELRGRYNLAQDAYDPHNNILAGTAYLREMYDAFGTPGFLAAYDGGPQRLEDYLTRNRPLPDETRRYVASVGRVIAGVYPARRAPAEMLAMNRLPLDIPAGPRWVVHRQRVLLAAARGRHGAAVRLAMVVDRHGRRLRVRVNEPVEVAEAPEPRAAWRSGPATHHGGFSLVSSAVASEPVFHGANAAVWKVQVGAYGGASAASAAARHAAGGGHVEVASVRQGHATLYRARVTGLTHAAALATCRRVGHCLVVAPNS